MNSYLTTSESASAATEPRLPSPASLPGLARAAEPTVARTVQLTPKRITWPIAGLMPVSTTVAAPQHQDGHFAGFGGCDVTDITFSTRLGPPSCSPPV